MIAMHIPRFATDKTEKRDGCLVGFSPRHLIPHFQQYDGARFRVTEVYSRQGESSVKRKKVRHNHGFTTAVLVENPGNTKKRKADKVEKDKEKKKSNTKTNNNTTD